MLVLGTTVGLINGLGVVFLRVHPLIITLGMGAILQGITLLYALGPVGSIPDGFDLIAYGTFGPVPAAAAITVVIYLAVAFFLRSSRFGRYIYAVGDDANAAKLIGLPRTQVLLFVYAFSGFFAAVSAIYLVARFGSGQPYAGANYTLASITPVVVGGTVLSGGRGGVMGTLLGAYLVSLLNNLLNFLDVSTMWPRACRAGGSSFTPRPRQRRLWRKTPSSSATRRCMGRLLGSAISAALRASALPCATPARLRWWKAQATTVVNI